MNKQNLINFLNSTEATEIFIKQGNYYLCITSFFVDYAEDNDGAIIPDSIVIQVEGIGE